jgi:hypothetical protein
MVRIWLFDKLVNLSTFVLGYTISQEAVMDAIRRYMRDHPKRRKKYVRNYP